MKTRILLAASVSAIALSQPAAAAILSPIDLFAETGASGTLYGVTGSDNDLATSNVLASATSTPSIMTPSLTELGANVATANGRAAAGYFTALKARAVSPEGALAGAATGLTQTVTNDTADVIKVKFGYRIDAGQMAFTARPYQIAPVTGDVLPEAYGQLGWAVSVDGSNVYEAGFTGFSQRDSGGALLANFGGTTGFNDATSLLTGFTVAGGQASWSDSYFIFELGTLNPGDSLLFSYILQGNLTANASAGLCNRDSFSLSGPGTTAVGCILSELNAGDPGNLSPMDVTSNLIGLAFERLGGGSSGGPVPEPATLALLGAGLAGLGLARRRMKTRA